MQGFSKHESLNQIVIDLRLDGTNDTILAALSDVWDSYADKSLIYPRLQDLYTRRQCAENIRNGKDSIWAIDWEQAGVSEKSGSVFAHYSDLCDTYQAEIERLEGRAGASRVPAVGASVAFGAATPWRPNPNNPAYGGDPLCRTRGGRAF